MFRQCDRSSVTARSDSANITTNTLPVYHPTQILASFKDSIRFSFPVYNFMFSIFQRLHTENSTYWVANNLKLTIDQSICVKFPQNFCLKYWKEYDIVKVLQIYWFPELWHHYDVISLTWNFCISLSRLPICPSDKRISQLLRSSNKKWWFPGEVGEGVGWKLFITKFSGSATVRPPPTNEVCEGYVFTRVCLSTGGGGIPACLAGGWYPSMPCRWCPSMLCRSPGGLQAHTQGGGVERSGKGGLQAHTRGVCTATAAGGTHHTGMHSCLVLFWVNDIIRCRLRRCVDNMETIASTESFIFSSSNNNYTRKVNQRSVPGEKVCGNLSLDVWLFFFSSLLVVLIMLWIFKRYFS